MQRIIRSARWARLLLSLVAALAIPSTAFAADGEIGDMGDTNSITDVYVSGGRAAVNIDYVKDCPAGITDCWIEVQFVSKCPEIWCGWDAHQWKRIPVTGPAKADCLGAGNEDNQWAVNYRTGFSAPAVKRVDWKGELESVLTTSGGIAYRLIAEAMFNWTNSAGFSTGTTVESVTASFDYSPVVQAATSGGRNLVTC